MSSLSLLSRYDVKNDVIFQRKIQRYFNENITGATVSHPRGVIPFCFIWRAFKKINNILPWKRNRNYLVLFYGINCVPLRIGYYIFIYRYYYGNVYKLLYRIPINELLEATANN